jgi:LPS sulfotransferase NodH
MSVPSRSDFLAAGDWPCRTLSAVYRVAYLIVGQPRRATGRLGEALTATGRLGRPEEYFWRGQEAHWAERFGVTSLVGEAYESYLEAVNRFATTPNGVFAAKVFWGHVEDLIDRVGDMRRFDQLAAQDRVRAVLPGELRAVHVRRNCLDAAISLWRAEETGVWLLRPGDVRPSAPERLDIARVSALHDDQHVGDANWVRLLEDVGVPRITVTHREIVEELGEVVSRIAALVGEAIAASSVATPSLLRLADQATERFVDEWRSAAGGCEECTPAAK